jgi:flagellar basal-body rod protein FlgB
MGIFDGINIAESAMSVHRYRSEVAADNIANINTPGYRYKQVKLQGADFATTLDGARSHVNGLTSSLVGADARDGAVQIASVREAGAGEFDERQRTLTATSDMIQAKSAFELSSKAATLLKSMALSALEIGRGS